MYIYIFKKTNAHCALPSWIWMLCLLLEAPRQAPLGSGWQPMAWLLAFWSPSGDRVQASW